MRTHQFEATQLLPTSLQEAWAFFTSPQHLAKITPPKFHLRIVSNWSENEFYEGMLINYRVRPLWGIPARWQTRIGPVHQPNQFADFQVRGPYRVWEHTHTFTPVEGGVEMHDRVIYRLPFGWFGRVFHRLFVRKEIEQLFAYRRATLERLFP